MAKVYKQISDLGKIVTGKTPSTAKPDLWDGVIPFITPTDINGFDTFYQQETERTVSEVGSKKQSKTLLPKDSICVTCIGSTIGKLCVTKVPSITNQQINSIIPNKDNDFRYVYYLIRENLNYLQLIGGGSGSGTPIISKNKFSKFKFLTEEDINVQRKIASVLSTYDALIENNKKRIKLLEQMAENLYKEWFVRFRFTGHENVGMENGLPKGWFFSNLGEKYSVTIGKTPPRKEFQWFTHDNPFAQYWMSISDMKDMYTGYTSEQLTQEAVERFNMVVVPEKTILLSFKLTVGRLTIALVPLCTNEAIAHIKEVPKFEHEYLYQHLKSYEYGKLGNTSSIGNAINSKIVKNMKIVIPSDDILEKFHYLVEPVFEQIKLLLLQNESLNKQRDLLLPRLMSGKLEIKA